MVLVQTMAVVMALHTKSFAMRQNKPVQAHSGCDMGKKLKTE